MLKFLARYILRDEQKATQERIDELRLDRDELVSILKLKKSHLDYVEMTLFEYRKIEELINQDVFKSLCRLLAKEYEEIEQNISDPTEMHRFWHCQGAKSIIHSFLTLDAVIKSEMKKLVLKKPVTEDSPSNVADYQ